MDFIQSFAHPKEMMALLRFKFGGCELVMSKCDFKNMSPSLRECYDLLNKTSPYFAVGIQMLEGELRDAVCILYLVLRALDTVEDDMTIPKNMKVPMLKNFYKNLEDPDWRYMESKDKDRFVLENFPIISKEFRELADIYKELITEICQKMGEGMTVYLERKVDTMEEWDEYCYYVAGMVVICLVQMVSACGQEDKLVGEDTSLANRVGVYLQRTHIIRDYLEDWNDQRIFWPKAAWSKYASDLGDFTKPENRERAVQCLNELITSALELVPSSILFMSRLRNQRCFNFFAIPQLTAVATLERCYNNPKLFTGVVKIRKGEVMRFFMGSASMEKFKAMMRYYTLKVIDKIPEADPSASKTRAVCQKILEVTETQHEYSTSTIYPLLYVSLGLMLTAIAYTYWSQIL